MPGYLNDVLVFDPALMKWTDLTQEIVGTPPSPRYQHGFSSAGSKLYLQGGFGITARGEGMRGEKTIQEVIEDR